MGFPNKELRLTSDRNFRRIKRRCLDVTVLNRPLHSLRNSAKVNECNGHHPRAAWVFRSCSGDSWHDF